MNSAAMRWPMQATSAPTHSQQATRAIAALPVIANTYVMHAMVARYSRPLKMPRPDAYGKAEQTVADWLAAYKARQPFPAQVFEGALRSAKELCTNSTSDSTAVRDLITTEAAAAQAKGVQLPTLFRETAQQYDAQRALKARQQANASDRNAYRAALGVYRDSLKGNSPASTPAAASAPSNGASAPQAAGQKTQLTQALEKLKSAIGKLKGLDDKYSLKFLSEERIAAIDETLGTLLDPKAAGDPAETDKDRIARTLKMLDDTAENWRAAQANAKEVLARPLLLQKSLDGLQAETLARSIASDEVELDLLRMRVELLTKQAHHYRQARDFLKGTEVHHAGPLQAMMFGKDPSQNLRNERTRVLQASAHYGHASGYLEGQLVGTTVKKQVLKNARQLDAAEINVRQWNVLIGSHVDLVAAWAATGVKEETISREVNSLLLLWIGAGVN